MCSNLAQVLRLLQLRKLKLNLKNKILRSIMIYIFELVGTNYIKLGYTRNENVYYRIQYGFWTNKHPPELCGKLSPVNLKLNCVLRGICILSP